jgi:hypothetical protein
MGPSVHSVVTSRVQIDGAYDPVMEGHGWRRMQYVIDVRFQLLRRECSLTLAYVVSTVARYSYSYRKNSGA